MPQNLLRNDLSPKLRILILEDNPADSELIQHELEKAGFAFAAKCVETKKTFKVALKKFSPHLILSDYDLPAYNGASALADAKSICPEIPFILVTGVLSEGRAVEILTSGAKDYVLKNQLSRLVPAVQRALAEAQENHTLF